MSDVFSLSAVRCPMSDVGEKASVTCVHYVMTDVDNKTKTHVQRDIGHRTSDIGHKK